MAWFFNRKKINTNAEEKPRKRANRHQRKADKSLRAKVHM